MEISESCSEKVSFLESMFRKTSSETTSLVSVECKIGHLNHSIIHKTPAFDQDRALQRQHRTKRLKILRSHGTSQVSLRDNRPKVLPDSQIRPTINILNHETFFVGQMQEANKAETSRNVVHGCLGVDRLQVVHDVSEAERGLWRLSRFGRGVDRRRWLRGLSAS